MRERTQPLEAAARLEQRRGIRRELVLVQLDEAVDQVRHLLRVMLDGEGGVRTARRFGVPSVRRRTGRGAKARVVRVEDSRVGAAAGLARVIEQREEAALLARDQVEHMLVVLIVNHHPIYALALVDLLLLLDDMVDEETV